MFRALLLATSASRGASAYATAEYFFNGGNVTCSDRTITGGQVAQFKQLSATDAASIGFTLPDSVDHPGDYVQKLFLDDTTDVQYAVPGYVDHVDDIHSNFDFEYELAGYRQGGSGDWIPCV
ncbi:hypothetical protein PYCC9005_004597 [Savitreella phatthalungensis]